MLNDFYISDTWRAFRKVVINERMQDGYTICEHCGKPILQLYDIVLHHVQELTESNYNDSSVSLNPDNIMIVHHVCHNRIHDKFNNNFNPARKVYVVYGSPLSGKSTYVHDVQSDGDMIIDMDNIWECVSGCDRYVKHNRLKSIVFAVRDTLLDCVKYRKGKWKHCYIIGGYPYKADRERLCKELGAEEIYIDTTKEECMRRLSEDNTRDRSAWTQFIDDWWNQFEGGY